MTEFDFWKKISLLGGELYIVGGWVRDFVRKVKPKDKDYVVVGLTEAEFTESFPEVLKVGKKFPVFLLYVDNKQCEVAFARTEKKNGQGYRGFVAEVNNVSLLQDLARRDTTMNSIAYDLKTKALIDPYNGQADIKAKVIRAVSVRFCEDPIRALRAARQAAEFDFTITDDTLELMKQCKQELLLEPGERFVAELNKALKAQRPSKFFYALEQAELLDVCFSEIANLTNIKHFKGNSFTILLEKLDEIAKLNNNIEIRFAVIINELAQTEGSFDCAKGLLVLKRFNQQLRLPKRWLDIVEFLLLTKEKIKMLNSITDSDEIVDILLSLEKSFVSVQDLSDFLVVNNVTVPDFIENYKFIIEKLLDVKGSMAPVDLPKPEIAKWLRKEQIGKYEEIVLKENTKVQLRETEK